MAEGVELPLERVAVDAELARGPHQVVVVTLERFTDRVRLELVHLLGQCLRTKNLNENLAPLVRYIRRSQPRETLTADPFALECRAMSSTLAEGLYEELITDRIERALDALQAKKPALRIERSELDHAEAHVVLARHLARELEVALASIGSSLPSDASAAAKRDARMARQLETANRILEFVTDPQHSDRSGIVARSEILRSITRDGRVVRPSTPLGTSTLLTRNRAEPSLGHELACEVASADRIDALLSFVTLGGVRLLRESFEAFLRRASEVEGPRLRVLTTTYMGATEHEAVEMLARLPHTEVRVSYDGRRTRLHAKAWRFERASGLSTAYVGSANLSRAALTGGHEWMMKVTAKDLPHALAKFEGAFESLWADSEFERFDADDATHRRRLREALGAARGDGSSVSPTLFTLRPYPFQQEILERLRAEREVHGRFRNLVVAATGTGKTVIAAFDYLAQIPASAIRPRLLFLAHRRELLIQARDTFRQVLRDGSFGVLLTGDDAPEVHDHVFATIASARSRQLLERFGASHFEHVIVDECHHLLAESYRSLVPALRPRILVGLTATPERADRASLLPDFDGHVAAEVRLWHALERQLLVPFEYFGISDGTDLSRVAFRRGIGYDVRELEAVYSGDQARARLIVNALIERAGDPTKLRALGFCVSVAHARAMAKWFEAAGIPAIAVDGESALEDRESARGRLERRQVNVVFTCDLYNEGVDLPFVDTLLFLRPTSSATLFLQQLGRGLRVADGKTSCLVLDFVGQHRKEFRFDAVLSAFTGVPRAKLPEAIAQDFPFLPSGCAIRLDAVARERLLASVKDAVTATHKRMAEELAQLAADDARNATLAGYLEASGRSLDDVYERAGSFTALRASARLAPELSSDAAETCRRVGRLRDIDDTMRLDTIDALVADVSDAAPMHTDRLRLMVGYQLVHETKTRFAAEEVGPYIRRYPEVRDELRELTPLLRDRIALADATLPCPDWPLVLHRHYSRRELLTAIGSWSSDRKVPHQMGIERRKEEKRELLFVTLEKSAASFSPTTRYRDYAISPTEFHWETQNAVRDGSEALQHYVAHVARGWSMHLAVQTRSGEPFAYLGPVDYVRHSGDRPVAIVWRLHHPMPAGLFQTYATLASG